MNKCPIYIFEYVIHNPTHIHILEHAFRCRRYGRRRIATVAFFGVGATTAQRTVSGYYTSLGGIYFIMFCSIKPVYGRAGVTAASKCILYNICMLYTAV